MSLLKNLSWRLPKGRPVRFDLLRRGYLLWACGGFLLAFLLGFVLFFPLNPLARQVEQQAAAQGELNLKIAEPGWSFPPGLAAARISLSSPEVQGETLELDNPRVTPLWGSLFGSNPGLHVTGTLLSGELDAKLRRKGELDLNLAGVRLEGQRLSPHLSILLSGRNGAVTFSGVLSPTGSGEGSGEVILEEIELSSMSALGSSNDTLDAGTLRIAAEMNGKVLNVKTLELTGGDLELSGSGSLLFGSRPEQTRVNLSLTIEPGAALDPQLRDLLSLLAKPEPDGTVKIRLLGSLTAPQLR